MRCCVHIPHHLRGRNAKLFIFSLLLLLFSSYSNLWIYFPLIQNNCKRCCGCVSLKSVVWGTVKIPNNTTTYVQLFIWLRLSVEWRNLASQSAGWCVSHVNVWWHLFSLLSILYFPITATRYGPDSHLGCYDLIGVHLRLIIAFWIPKNNDTSQHFALENSLRHRRCIFTPVWWEWDVLLHSLDPYFERLSLLPYSFNVDETSRNLALGSYVQTHQLLRLSRRFPKLPEKQRETNACLRFINGESYIYFLDVTMLHVILECC